jgi:hypothetical protein
VDDITDQPEEVDENARPNGYTLDSSFLFLRLSNFVQIEPGWVLSNLELFDQKCPLDAGALGNQTSPLYVALRSRGAPLSEDS